MDRLERIEQKVDKIDETLNTFRLEVVGEYVRKPVFMWSVGTIISLIVGLKIFG